jgi:5-methylcytosine-specific restriction endonuclease McrA
VGLIQFEASQELTAAIEKMAKEEMRTPTEYVAVVLHRHMFGQVTPCTDEEWEAYKAAKAEKGRTPRIPITAKQRNRIFERCDGKCAYCGGVLLYDQPFHIDHIVPLSKGGTNDENNLTLACVLCNVRKRDKLVAVK